MCLFVGYAGCESMYYNTGMPVNTRRWHNAVFMLDQRRRLWTNIKAALGQRLAVADPALGEPGVRPPPLIGENIAFSCIFWNKVKLRPLFSAKKWLTPPPLVHSGYATALCLMRYVTRDVLQPLVCQYADATRGIAIFHNHVSVSI